VFWARLTHAITPSSTRNKEATISVEMPAQILPTAASERRCRFNFDADRDVATLRENSRSTDPESGALTTDISQTLGQLRC
jgi:hypothetical protein